MNIEKTLRKGIPLLIWGAMIFSQLSCSSIDKKGIQYRDEIRNEKNENGFNWILYKDKGKITYGKKPDKKNPKRLEELVFTDKDPSKIELTEWEVPFLSRLVPLKKLIEKHAPHYNINAFWATMFFNKESQLYPADNNTLSNDFGLGQIKRRSEKLAKKLGTDFKHKYYSPYLKKHKSIFDPENNILMAMLLNRYNIDRFNLKNSDQAYAIYWRGEPGLNPDGSLSELTKDELDFFRERYKLYENVIPLFRLGENGIQNIKNEDTKKLLEIYHSKSSVKDMYKKQLNYFLTDLKKNVNGEARSVLVYEDCVVFSKTLNEVWKINQTKNYKTLLRIGKKLSKQVVHEDLKERVENSYNLLKE